MRIIGLCGARLSDKGVVVGSAGAGKDTVGAMLASKHVVKDEHGNWYPRWSQPLGALFEGGIQTALADPIKELCRVVYGFTVEQLWGPSASRNKPDVRWRREYDHHLEVQDDKFLFRCSRCDAGWDVNGEPRDGMEPVKSKCRDFLTPREALQTLGTEWARHRHPDTWVRLLISRCEDLERWSRADKTCFIVTDVRFVNEAATIRQAGGTIWRIDRPVGGDELHGVAASHASELSVADIVPDKIIWNGGDLQDLRARVERLAEEFFL